VYRLAAGVAGTEPAVGDDGGVLGPAPGGPATSATASLTGLLVVASSIPRSSRDKRIRTNHLIKLLATASATSCTASR
jgi:hypothetical protein